MILKSKTKDLVDKLDSQGKVKPISLDIDYNIVDKINSDFIKKGKNSRYIIHKIEYKSICE